MNFIFSDFCVVILKVGLNLGSTLQLNQVKDVTTDKTCDVETHVVALFTTFVGSFNLECRRNLFLLLVIDS